VRGFDFRPGNGLLVYRADLARLPNNGWSLFGLSEALMQQGKMKEVAALRSQFKEIWRKADVTITSSCLCQPVA